ncbi:MAG TPA: vWA domain-containing protein [Polyangiaceae bacterium]|nr:vWA domain-containing protein [Polyangiaceae bacterium]
MNSTSLRAILVALVSGALYAGCSGEDERAYLESGDTPPDEPDDGDGDPNDPPDEPDASTSIPDAASMDHDAGGDAGDASTVGIVYRNCGEAVCAGTKKCVETSGGAYCDCDAGFERKDLDDSNFECVTNTSCIQMRALACGQDPHAAVYQAFHIQYCSGEPVPPSEIDVTQSFALFQDGTPPDPNESYWTFRTNHVESAVVIALDASGSVINDAVRFEPLIQSVRDFVKLLRPTPTDPPVSFGMLLFGRTVGQFIEPTTDLNAVDAQLADLQANGTAVVGIDPGGTALYDAVEVGLELLGQGMGDLMTRSGGALSFGTLVVVTDGDNESGSERLRADLIKDSVAAIISMGINVDLADSVLTSIGRDGSFLAPDKRGWDSTLIEVARRVRARTDAIYEVAYCSPATEGNHDLKTAMTDTALNVTSAICADFDADSFGDFTSNECKVFVDTECTGDAAPQCGIGTFQICPYTCVGGEACFTGTCALE